MSRSAETEPWERRERKLVRRRDGMRVHGAGLKKVLLPLLERRAKDAERKAAVVR